MARQTKALNYVERVAFRVREELGEGIPQGEDGSRLSEFYALLILVKGTSLTVEDVHDAWSIWMTAKDRSHKSIRPFAELDARTQQQDVPYFKALQQIASEL